jgi:seryl-tRNA synthetase
VLDIKLIRKDPELVKRNCAARNVRINLDLMLSLDTQRRELDAKIQELRAASKKIAAEKSADFINEGRRLRAEISEGEQKLAALVKSFDEIYHTLPNLTHPTTPIGVDESASRTIAYGVNDKPTFGFTPKDHLDIATTLGVVDMAAGTKVAGPGFYFLNGDAALLELALQNYAINKLVSNGFRFQITPDIAKNDILLGTGYVPRGNETNTYTLEDTDLSLIATAEIPLCGQFTDTVVDVSSPIKICGLSHCFRTERAAGKATRGLYRVHQFTKVEMVVLCDPEASEDMHLELLKIEKEIFDELGLPYRVLDIASGDLGASAYKKYDIEAWMPGRNGGEFGEVTSTSNCTDFQARRMNIRHVSKNGQREFVHTLNGTAIAISRAMVAIIENFQTSDGRVMFPQAIAKLLGIKGLDPLVVKATP